jgi:hypothetical protein
MVLSWESPDTGKSPPPEYGPIDRCPFCGALGLKPNPYAAALLREAESIESALKAQPITNPIPFEKLAADFRTMAKRVIDATGFMYAMCYVLDWHPRFNAERLMAKVREAEEVAPRVVYAVSGAPCAAQPCPLRHLHDHQDSERRAEAVRRRDAEIKAGIDPDRHGW